MDDWSDVDPEMYTTAERIAMMYHAVAAEWSCADTGVHQEVWS
jgi:hypothetical protein